MQFRPEHIYTFIVFISSILGMWSTLSAKLTRQENRSTALEKDIENLKEFKECANHRLDNHDEQNKAILVLAEQVKNMADDIRDLKRVIMKEN